MKHSDLNHLRRLLAWVDCEIGQSPQELEATVKNIAAKLGNIEIDDAAKARIVQSHDNARAVPKYVRAALKALQRTIGPGETVDEPPANQPEPFTPEEIEWAESRGHHPVKFASTPTKK